MNGIPLRAADDGADVDEQLTRALARLAYECRTGRDWMTAADDPGLDPVYRAAGPQEPPMRAPVPDDPRRVRCGGCGIDYPPQLVEPAVLELVDPDSLEAVGPQVVTVTCGICALLLANAVSGEQRTRFEGPKAEALRQGAIAWRREHGYADA